MDQQAMKQKIMDYIAYAHEWHQTGNGPVTEGAGLMMSDLEEEILTGFGLPFMAFQFSEILQLEGFSNKRIEKRALKLIDQLTTEASLYLLSPIKNKYEALMEAKIMFTDAVEVLPLIDFSTNVYTVFLYYDYFLRSEINAEEFIKYAKMTTDADEEEATRIPFTYQAIKKRNQLKRLINEGFPYVNEFRDYLKYLSASNDWVKKDTSHVNSSFSKSGDIIIVSKAYITYIAIKNEDNAAIEMLINFKGNIIPIRLWCSVFGLTILLKCSKYWSLSIPFLYATRPPFDDDTIHIYPEEMNGKNIETSDVILILEKSRYQGTKKDPPYFEVIYMKLQVPKIKTASKSDGLPF